MITVSLHSSAFALVSFVHGIAVVEMYAVRRGCTWTWDHNGRLVDDDVAAAIDNAAAQLEVSP